LGSAAAVNEVLKNSRVQ